MIRPIEIAYSGAVSHKWGEQLEKNRKYKEKKKKEKRRRKTDSTFIPGSIGKLVVKRMSRSF